MTNNTDETGRGLPLTPGEKVGAALGTIIAPAMYFLVFDGTSMATAVLFAIGGAIFGWALDMNIPGRVVHSHAVRRTVAVTATKAARKSDEKPRVREDLDFGEILENGRRLLVPVRGMGHILIRGITQNGKTNTVYFWFKQFLTNFEAGDVRVFIFDGKQMDWRAFKKYRFLMGPVAQTPDEWMKLARLVRSFMVYRQGKFNEAQDHFETVINNIESYNAIANTPEGREFGMRPLPVCIVLLDEAQHIILEGYINKLVTEIATLGMGMGIYYLITTQYNTANNINMTIQMQANYTLTGFVSTDLNSYATGGKRLPKDVDMHYIMQDIKGRFLVTHRAMWQTVQIPYVPFEELKALMDKRHLAAAPEWPDLPQDNNKDDNFDTFALSFADMTTEQKLQHIVTNLGTDPSVDEIQELTGLGRSSSFVWRSKVREKEESSPVQSGEDTA